MRSIEVALLTLCLGGCTASVQSRATTSASHAEAESALDAELEASVRAERGVAASTPVTDGRDPADEAVSVADPDGSRLALLGARHDLGLRTSADETCHCLAVHAGDATDPMFVWETRPPRVDASSQLVVAFEDHSATCGGPGAAYRGYQAREGDVVVLIEQAVPGRPALSGAIVPRPQGDGRLWIRPTPATLRYGQPLNTDGNRCAIPLDADDPRAAATRASAGAPTSVPEQQDAPTDGDGPEEIPLEEGPHSPRDGFYLAILPALEYPMVDLLVGAAPATASGIGFGFDLLIGTSIVPGLTLGGAIGGAAAPQPKLVLTLPTGEQLGERLDGASLNLFRLGALADYYPFPQLGFHALLSAGYTNVGLSGATDDAESLHGFGLTGGLGYDFWVSYHLSLGLLARLQWALVSGDGSDGTSLLSPALAATLTFH